MSFSDRRRDDGEGRGVEGKYMPWGVIGAQIVRPDALPVVIRCWKHSLDLVLSSTTHRLLTEESDMPHFIIIMKMYIVQKYTEKMKNKK